MESPRNCLWWLGVDLLEIVMETVVKGFRHGAGTLGFSKAKKSFTRNKWLKWWKVMTECRFRGRGKGMCFRGTGQECFPYPCLCPCCLSLWALGCGPLRSVALTGAASHLQAHSLTGAQEEHRALQGRSRYVNAFRIQQMGSCHAMKAMFCFLAPNHVPNPRKSPVQWTSLFPSASIQHFA